MNDAICVNLDETIIPHEIVTPSRILVTFSMVKLDCPKPIMADGSWLKLNIEDEAIIVCMVLPL